MIDSHCHLADEAFDADAASVIARARAAGLAGALCILDAGSQRERDRAVDLAQAWPGLRFAIGIHPHQSGTWLGRVADVRRAVTQALDEQPLARAIGETGLDYHYDLSPRDVQRDVFAAQIELALDRDLPVVVHAREADEDVLAIIREAGRGRLRGVMHCFTGSARFAHQVLELGFRISLAGIVTFPNAAELREVSKLVPDDLLLIETDSPFLAPVPHRGQRNEPGWVALVAERLAAVRGVAVGDLARRTAQNYEALFGAAAG